MDVRNLEVVNSSPEAVGQPWLLKLLISSLSLVFLWLALFSGLNHLPFSTQCVGASCEVTASAAANTASASPRLGDRVLLTEQPFATRAVLIDDNVPRNRDYAVTVRRGAQRVRTMVHTVSKPDARGFARRSIITFAFLFGLLMLWRGESAASRGLCLFALSIVLTSGLTVRPFAPPWNLIANSLAALGGGPGAFMGLYITADALARVDRDSRAAHRARAAYLGALLLLYLTEVVPVALVAAGRDVPLAGATQVATLVLALVAWIVPLIYLLKGYRASIPANRLRIRWFIASIALLLPQVACNLLLQSGGFSPAETDLLGVAQVLLTLAIFAMLSYAALSQRLVAVRFVANRALVFGILTASLIGVLSLLESLIERSVISKEAGLALDILVPLLLGVSIHRIHRWGEDSVERVVFRSEYRNRNAILAFLRDAGFISRPATLYERTVEVFGTHSGGRYAALYLADKSGYERVAASDHAREPPARIAVDDVAMVRLRATLAPLDLFTLSSPLGATGLALPLVIRGRLEGVLVCGAKAEGRYAQAEIDFLSKAATGIAACVIALRAELHGRFVGKLAEGALSAESIMEEARSLVQS